jgi:hypothetical protein
MKIEQLLQREPFGDILESSISRFLNEYLGKQYQCTWAKSGIFHRREAKSNTAAADLFFCNPYMNVLFSKNIGPLIADFVQANYMHTPFRHRRLAQKAYVTLATHPYTARLLTTYILKITPQIPNSRNLVFLGGNNRIRMIDLQKMRTWDILKTGFDQVYMTAELAVRNRPGEWPFPKLYNVGENVTWFESQYIPAVSIGRIGNNGSYICAREKALKFLKDWLNLNITITSIKEYGENLVSKMNSLYNTTHQAGSARELFKDAMNAGFEIFEAFRKHEMLDVYLADGHGDFQEGNILVDKKGEIWIVDWENSGQRQIAYDYLVFILRSRFPSGLSHRIKTALQNPEYVLSKLPIIHEKFHDLFLDTKYRAIILLTFLLEELIWNLREGTNPLFFNISGALPGLLIEAKPSLTYILNFLK